MFNKLGRFEIKDVIGRGAMGEVYLGVDPVLGREVAIKTIISSALPEDVARLRFDREAKAAAVLNSPNIVTIHELGEDQGVLFIAMERLKGQDLEQILLERNLTLVESLEVLAQVCDGLDVAHRNHIIHRDIKPSNIMVMREGRKLLAKLMDFGVARLKDSAMTVKGTVVGTVNYIAPEYIRSGEPDARSDLFAVGVMLYECISGRKPFDGGSASTVLFKIVNDPPDPLDLPMLQGLSPALRNMTERSLAKDPDERFQTAEEFALALRAAKDPAWNGKLEETTLRMEIQPLQPPAAIESAVAETMIAEDITQDLAIPPEPAPAAPCPEPVPLEGFKTISIQLPHNPKAGPRLAQTELAKTQVLSLPAATATRPAPPPAIPAEPLQAPPAAASASTAEIAVPPLASKTEILQVPSVAASAGTAEITVPPLAPKTEILQVPPLSASAGTAEIAVPPMAPKTEILQVPPVSASTSTAEITVPPLAPKTEILQVPAAAASPVALPNTTEAAVVQKDESHRLLNDEPMPVARAAQEGVAELVSKGLGVGAQALPLSKQASTAAKLPAPLGEVPAVSPSPVESVGPEGTSPLRSSKGLIYAVVGLLGLAIIGGAGYLLYKSRAAQPATVTPLPPAEPVPPPIVETPPVPTGVPPVPETLPAPPPAAAPARPAKAPRKAAPTTKVPAPAPAPEPVAAPVPPVVTTPLPLRPTPPVEQKKKGAEETTRKRREEEDRSK